MGNSDSHGVLHCPADLKCFCGSRTHHSLLHETDERGVAIDGSSCPPPITLKERSLSPRSKFIHATERKSPEPLKKLLMEQRKEEGKEMSDRDARQGGSVSRDKER